MGGVLDFDFDLDFSVSPSPLGTDLDLGLTGLGLGLGDLGFGTGLDKNALKVHSWPNFGNGNNCTHTGYWHTITLMALK